MAAKPKKMRAAGPVDRALLRLKKALEAELAKNESARGDREAEGYLHGLEFALEELDDEVVRGRKERAKKRAADRRYRARLNEQGD